jgi:hypothetical protein
MLKSSGLLFIAFALFNSFGYSQTDTTKNNLLDDLSSVQDTESQQLLPQKIIVTQRILWGQNGLMRNFKTFELTPEERERELRIRRAMLVTHQVLGFVTLGTMVAQGIVGSQLYNGKQSVRDLHEGLAVAVNFGYFTTAGLALFAPPKMLDERKGYSSIKVHKYLAIVHMTSMIATNILAGELESHPNLKPYHRAAAFTAFGAFATAMVVIKF